MEFSPTFPEEFDGRVNVMILGEAPGAEEEKVGLPFVGKSGKFLMQELETVGFTRNCLYISNVFWERPPDNDVGYFFCNKTSSEEKAEQFPLFKNRFLKKEWENQIYRLQDELEMLRPYMILTVGCTPLWALTGNDSITDLRGKPYIIAGPVKYKYSIVFPTYHPAYAMRNKTALELFRQDLMRFRELHDTPAWDWPHMFGEEYDEAFGN